MALPPTTLTYTPQPVENGPTGPTSRPWLAVMARMSEAPPPEPFEPHHVAEPEAVMVVARPNQQIARVRPGKEAATVVVHAELGMGYSRPMA